jgi:chitinase
MASGYEPVPTTDSSVHLPTPSELRKKPYKRVWLLISAGLVLSFVSFKAGQWSEQFHPQVAEPASATISVQDNSAVTATSSQSSLFPSPSQVEPTPSESSHPVMSTSGKYNVGYFVNWGIYGRKFPPQSIPVQDLTHILYAFAKVSAETGEVVLSDKWADSDIHYPGDSWNEPQGNLYGNFKSIYLLKKQNRHLKVLLSIGGWTYSPSFHPVVVNPAARAQFVESSIRILEDYGLDGLDVDYEYPTNDEQARGYVDLLREMRQGLDRHAASKGANYRFLLTIAAPCGPDNYQKLHVADMDKHLDFWNMMSYDFSGSWDQIANHQANLYGPPISASGAVQWYIDQGVPHHKIVLGIPLYGRSFMQTQGPTTPFNGIGPGSWEQGVYDYRALPLPGSYIHRDAGAGASWSYDYDKKEMVSFDDAQVAQWKGEWIRDQGLGGAMYWELSGDKGNEQGRQDMEKGLGKDYVDGPSIVRIVKDAMGGLDTSQNWLQYEGSQFPNMRAGME